MQWKLAAQTWAEAAGQYQDLEHAFAHHAVALVIADLVNGSAYDVRVAAYNANGLSTWVTGSATPAKPKAGAPAAASGLKLAAGDGEIAVSWSASSTTPGAGFGYRVQWKPAAKGWGDAEARSADLAHGSNLATSYAIGGLVNGSAYDVRVAAYSAGGVSAWITGSATPKASAPAAASGLKLVAGDGEIAVSWSASSTTPGAGFGYRVQWKPAAKEWDGAEVRSADLVYGSNLAKSYTISGLSNGSAYDVRVAAYSAGGVSDWIGGSATPVAPPEVPSGLSLVAGNYRIAVSWSASATTPAAGFGYRVQWKPAAKEWGGAEAKSADLAHGSNLATSYTTGWVANGSVYDVRVAAYSAGGLSAWITGQATPVLPDPPEAASGLSLVAGDGEIAVSWTASSTPTKPWDGFGYRVAWKPADKTWGGAGDSALLVDGSSLATSYTISGLSNGSVYDVRVAAYNDGGPSAWITGQATPAAPKAPAPAAASGLKLVAGDEQIAVSWSASATTPAAGFGYRVQWKPTAKAWGDAAAQSTDLAHGTSLATSHTIGGLSNGSAYDVRVAAYNADGVSDWITGSATPTAPKTPAPPWAYSTVAYATLDECTANAGTRWCGYYSGLWYVDSRD